MAATADNRTGNEGGGAFSVYRRISGAAFRIGVVVCMASVLALLVVTGYSVWGRYVMNDPPTWAENSSLMYMVVIAFVGGGLVVRERGHLRVVFVLKALPGKWRLGVELAGSAVVLLLAVAMTVGGAQAAIQVWDIDDPMLPISRGSYYIPITLCGALIVLFEIEQVVMVLTGRTPSGKLSGGDVSNL